MYNRNGDSYSDEMISQLIDEAVANIMKEQRINYHYKLENLKSYSEDMQDWFGDQVYEELADIVFYRYGDEIGNKFHHRIDDAIWLKLFDRHSLWED